MGVVYRAQHMHLGRTVALKLLNPELAASTEFRERFIREAQAAAELEHPNIVPVYDAGEVDGRLYIAMKFIDGTDLAHVLEKEGTVSPERTMHMMKQLAEALDVAHQRGLIHRDVKPANALLEEDDRLYLTDFGLTRRVDSSRPLTATGRAVGTAAYLAPEQIRGEPLDRRVDVYALGCVLYQCLAGKPPYMRDTDMLIMWAHVGAEPPSLSAERTELPATVDRVIKKALAKSREDRYDTCGEMIIDMSRALNPSQPLETPQSLWHEGMPDKLPKVLLVTADPGASLSIEAALRRSRLTLDQAADADAAKERAEQEPPTVVLLDAGLENGGALRLAQALREGEATRGAKIVLLTNQHARVDMAALAPIVDDYLSYPFPPLQLFTTLREHIPEAFGESRSA